MDNEYELVEGEGLNNGYLWFVEPVRKLLAHCNESTGDIYVLAHGGNAMDLALVVLDDREEGCEGKRVGYVVEMYSDNAPGEADFETTDISMWLGCLEPVHHDVLRTIAPLVKKQLGLNIRDENNEIVE